MDRRRYSFCVTTSLHEKTSYRTKSVDQRKYPSHLLQSITLEWTENCWKEKRIGKWATVSGMVCSGGASEGREGAEPPQIRSKTLNFLKSGAWNMRLWGLSPLRFFSRRAQPPKNRKPGAAANGVSPESEVFWKKSAFIDRVPPFRSEYFQFRWISVVLRDEIRCLHYCVFFITVKVIVSVEIEST